MDKITNRAVTRNILFGPLDFGLNYGTNQTSSISQSFIATNGGHVFPARCSSPSILDDRQPKL